MENKNNQSTKTLWEELTDNERKRYYIQSKYVIERGLSNLDFDFIAKKIYENSNA